jgi:hypothetical protein
MLNTISMHPQGMPLSAALELATRRTIAQCTALAQRKLVAQLDRAESAITQARQIADAIV